MSTNKTGVETSLVCFVEFNLRSCQRFYVTRSSVSRYTKRNSIGISLPRWVVWTHVLSSEKLTPRATSRISQYLVWSIYLHIESQYMLALAESRPLIVLADMHETTGAQYYACLQHRRTSNQTWQSLNCLFMRVIAYYFKHVLYAAILCW